MELYKFTPELVEKRKWVYQHLVRNRMRKRFGAILKYAGYTAEDLACVLGKPLETIEKYLSDCTEIPIDDLWLIALLCNVSVDCFPDTRFYLDLELSEE